MPEIKRTICDVKKGFSAYTRVSDSGQKIDEKCNLSEKVSLVYENENIYGIRVHDEMIGYFEYVIEGNYCYLKQLLITSKEYRKKGIGSLALAKFEKIMKDRKIDAILIEDASGTSFWEHRGYVVDEDMPRPTNRLGYIYRIKKITDSYRD